MILIFVWAVIVLSIILSLVEARFEEQKAALSTGTIESLWWAGKIVFFILLLMVFWVALFFYADHLRSRIDTIELAARMKFVVSVAWWVTIALLVLLGAEFLIVLYKGSHRIVFAAIQFLLLSLCLGFLLLDSWIMLKYFRTHTLRNVVAVCLREQSDKFIHARNFDKAYAVLIKASETAPDETEIWCRLAFFCELIRKNTTEADEFIAKAGELIATKKVVSNSDKTCYLNYLGTILYGRGECEKGLEYIKQSIDIEPSPGRISSYEKKLLEYKQSPSNNTV